jgi:hypothetical protein
MFTKLISRLDNWSLQLEGTLAEVPSPVDGAPLTIYIPHRPMFLIAWFKDFWAIRAIDRLVAKHGAFHE